MNDPVKGCQVYKEIGCAHVDGFLCDYPNCSILKNYRMNERIRELADKIWAEEYWDNPNTDKLLPAQLNKFAELIVRECITVARGADGLDATHEAWYLIREHFGVDGMSTEDKKTLIKELLGVKND